MSTEEEQQNCQEMQHSLPFKGRSWRVKIKHFHVCHKDSMLSAHNLRLPWEIQVFRENVSFWETTKEQKNPWLTHHVRTIWELIIYDGSICTVDITNADHSGPNRQEKEYDATETAWANIHMCQTRPQMTHYQSTCSASNESLRIRCLPCTYWVYSCAFQGKQRFQTACSWATIY